MASTRYYRDRKHFMIELQLFNIYDRDCNYGRKIFDRLKFGAGVGERGE